jgi:hypothetical protein
VQVIAHGAGARSPHCASPRSGTAAWRIALVVTGTSMRVANTKATTELGWRPAFPTYRKGIQAMAGPAPARR